MHEVMTDEWNRWTTEAGLTVRHLPTRPQASTKQQARRTVHVVRDWNVNSVSTGVVFNDVYAASKFAMEGFCESLAVQLLKFNVT